MRTCRFYMGELLMSLLALSAALYGMAAVNRWSFSVFLTLQGEHENTSVVTGRPRLVCVQFFPSLHSRHCKLCRVLLHEC